MKKEHKLKFRCTRTRVPDKLKAFSKIPFCLCRKYNIEYNKANTLLDICADNYNGKPDPPYWSWTPKEIADHILEETGLPEYYEAFVKSEICGKAVAHLEADKFPRISIKQFDIIKKLTAKIRDLCNMDQDEFKRSISLPPRRPQTLFLWYKTKRTGPTSYYMTPSKYFKMVHIIPEETACGPSYYDPKNHWNRISSYMPWCPHIMIGGNRRINPMTGTVRRQNFHSKDHPYLLKEDALCMYHFPCGYEFPVKKDSLSTAHKRRKPSSMLPCN